MQNDAKYLLHLPMILHNLNLNARVLLVHVETIVEFLHIVPSIIRNDSLFHKTVLNHLVRESGNVVFVSALVRLVVVVIQRYGRLRSVAT